MLCIAIYLNNVFLSRGHRVNGGSNDQAHDEPYDHNVGTLRRNDYSKHHFIEYV